jgi:protein-S-isoprenylcysteine O-methyltransferase Ste14
MTRKRYESIPFTIGMFVLVAAGMILSALDPTGHMGIKGVTVNIQNMPVMNLVLFIVGVLMLITGGFIRMLAIVALRRNFSGALRIREGHTLTTNSVFRYVRHPAYLGAIILFLGFPVIFSSVLGFLVMLLLIPYLLHRIKLEEKMLIEHFGDQYLEYMKRTKKLIPFVY